MYSRALEDLKLGILLLSQYSTARDTHAYTLHVMSNMAIDTLKAA